MQAWENVEPLPSMENVQPLPSMKQRATTTSMGKRAAAAKHGKTCNYCSDYNSTATAATDQCQAWENVHPLPSMENVQPLSDKHGKKRATSTKHGKT